MVRKSKRIDPLVELSQFRIDPPSVRLLTRNFCMHNRVVILDKVDQETDDEATLAMLNPQNRTLQDEVSRYLDRPVRAVQLSDEEIQRAIDQGFALAKDEKSSAKDLILDSKEAITFSRSISISETLNEILGKAVLMGATDVHIETYENDVDVRVRVDGILHHINTPVGISSIKALVSRIKVLAMLDIAEHRISQDGRIRGILPKEDGKKLVDFRVSVIPGRDGEDVVLRILDTGKPLLGLEELGFRDEIMETFEQIISNPEGLILVTGPTSSGKTTTLYAALKHLNHVHNKILTVEDPIEYTFPKINQKQVTAQMGFADYVRAFLRQNPDIILIGEIRDEETADVAMRAAQTGHLVLASLHTNDSVSAVSRLETLKVERDLIASCLLGVVSQRLVRKLCLECRYPQKPSIELRKRLQLADSDLSYFSAKGCEQCGSLKYQGRTGIYELFVVDSEISDMISSGSPILNIRRLATQKGMKSMLDNALQIAKSGVTELEEILRVVPYRIIAERAQGKSWYDSE